MKGGWLASGSELARRAVTAECNQFCHPVQRYAAIQCNGMPSAITKWCAKSHPRHRRAVAQRRFDQDVVGVRRWRVWCGLRRPNRNQRFEFQTVWMRISACWRNSTIERKPIGGALPTFSVPTSAPRNVVDQEWARILQRLHSGHGKYRRRTRDRNEVGTRVVFPNDDAEPFRKSDREVVELAKVLYLQFTKPHVYSRPVNYLG